MARLSRRILPTFTAALALGAALAPLSARALDGGNPVFITVPTAAPTLGWKTFEIIQGNDTLGALAQEGFTWTANHSNFDGLGAYKHDADTLRLFINHEVASGSFSRIDLDLSNLEAWIAAGIPNNTNTNQVAAPGQIVKAVSLGWTSVGSGTPPINRPCSANIWPADTFGPGRGFAEPLYLTSEESAGGHFWVMDVATRTLYEAPDVGGAGKWENGCIIDTGRTDTIALLLSEDAGSNTTLGTATLRLYVGLKNPAGNFLERNGLSGGITYHWDPDGTASTAGTMSGIFAGGNGTVVPGTWVTSTTGAALFSKSEDVHPNVNPLSPGYGVEAVLACENQAVFEIDFSQLDFVAGDLGAARGSGILVLFKAGTQDISIGNSFSDMDNLVWSTDGLVYVNEDESDGDIWAIDRDSLKASYAALDFTPDPAQVYEVLDTDFVGESSGIIEISSFVGYQPGGVFLTAGQSSTLTVNQVALLVSPGAALNVYALAYSAGPGGTLTGATIQNVTHGNDATTVTAVPGPGYGFVDWSDGVLTASRTDLDVSGPITATANFEITNHYLVWISGFPSLTGGDLDPTADPEFDGLWNLLEYAFNLDPTLPDPAILAAGTGTMGLPLVEIRDFGPAKRLVIEYLRRIGATDLVYSPQFGAGLSAGGWGPGTNETVSPINASFERVVIEDTVDLGPGITRFGRLKVELVPGP